MASIVPRWEWRTFARSVRADAVFDALEANTVDESDEVYLLAPGGDNVKVRHGLVDVKVLRQRPMRPGCSGGNRSSRSRSPSTPTPPRTVFQGLRRPLPEVPTDGLTLDDVLAAAGAGEPGGPPRRFPVRKQRHRYTVAGCQAERAVFEVGPHRTTSIAVESTDPAAVLATIQHLGLAGYVNVDVPAGLRRMVDAVPQRYAVIDAGTNSTKFHVAELDADGHGPWRSVVDRAVVTRLGEGLEATGDIGAEPLERTVHAMSAMADEARDLGVLAFAVVGTAGLRRARNQAVVAQTLRERAGSSLEVIPGDEEGRLAYVAVATGVGLGEGTVVAFDTGGGSSQFSFGRGPVVDERFSLEVGAVRFTERFGLTEAVSPDVVAEARAAMADDLGRLDGRPEPDAVVAMGGAVTNLAAVKHGLTHLRPRCRPGHPPGPGRGRPADRAVPLPGRGRAAGDRRPPARPGPRSSSPGRASCAPSWTSSAARSSP